MAVTQIDGARQIRFTNSLDLETNRIVNVVDPSADQDAAAILDCERLRQDVTDHRPLAFNARLRDKADSISGFFEIGRPAL